MRSLSPYEITVEDAIYSFRTDQDLEYRCSFLYVNPFLSPVVGVYDIEVSEFQFSKVDRNLEKRKQFDPRIFATVRQLAEAYFDKPERVLLYMCDPGDGRQSIRHRLFIKWFDDIEGFTRDNLEVEVLGAEMMYGSAITRNDFPHRGVLDREVISTLKGYAAEKFG